MSKLNLLLSINAYQDENPTNHPSKSNWKWVSDLQGIDIEEPYSSTVKLAPGQSLQLFSGETAISDDNTTTYDLNLKSGSTNLYILKHNSGTAPVFRTERSTGADATTEVTVTKNGPLLTFSSTGGTALNLISGGAVVGDEVRIQNIFNALNQGKFKILALTATSFTVENASGQPEGPITLGAGFAADFRIYSQTGVQIGEKVKIDSGFSSVTFGTYEISDVGPDFIQIYSLKTLPEETDISEELNIYNNSKKFLYLESNKTLSVTVDGSDNGKIEPFSLDTKLKPGIYLKNSSMYSAQITNESQETATVFYATAE